MKTEPLSIFVVTCSHVPIYGAFVMKDHTESICRGCCEDAEVVEYVRK